jgi:hypothetical protein
MPNNYVRQYVFLVHGMGKQEKGWSDSFVDAIVKALPLYTPYRGVTRDDITERIFKLIPITYDHVFEGYRRRWEELGGEVADRIGDANPRIGQVFTALKNSGEESFFWTHLHDVLLWYGLSEARKAVVQDVAGQVADQLEEMNDSDPESSAHVLAHSLGTSVSHDALLALHHFPEYQSLGASRVVWQTVGMIANVGRLAQSNFPLDGTLDTDALRVHESLFRPGVEGSICTNYVNVHNTLDPFTWPRPFDPTGWPARVSYEDIEVTRIRKLTQVHDFDHYFADPDVHRTLLGLITGEGPGMGVKQEKKDARGDYKAVFKTDAAAEFDGIRALLQPEPSGGLSVGELAKYVLEVYRKLEELTT